MYGNVKRTPADTYSQRLVFRMIWGLLVIHFFHIVGFGWVYAGSCFQASFGSIYGQVTLKRVAVSRYAEGSLKQDPTLNANGRDAEQT